MKDKAQIPKPLSGDHVVACSVVRSTGKWFNELTSQARLDAEDTEPLEPPEYPLKL